MLGTDKVSFMNQTVFLLASRSPSKHCAGLMAHSTTRYKTRSFHFAYISAAVLPFVMFPVLRESPVRTDRRRLTLRFVFTTVKYLVISGATALVPSWYAWYDYVHVHDRQTLHGNFWSIL